MDTPLADTIEKIEQERAWYALRASRASALIRAGRLLRRDHLLEEYEYADGARWGLDLALSLLQGDEEERP